MLNVCKASFVLWGSTKKAFYNVLYGFTREDNSALTSPLCSTGNCTWPTFSSLAVCSACKDLTDTFRRPTGGRSDIWCLPNNAYTSKSFLVSTDTGDGTNAYNGTADQALIDLFYTCYDSPPKDGSIRPYASKCKLYLCVQKLSAFVVGGVGTERLLSSWPDPATPNP